MRRNLEDELDHARQALAVAKMALARCREDCRERLRAKREWLLEAQRRLRLASAAVNGQATPGLTDAADVPTVEDGGDD